MTPDDEVPLTGGFVNDVVRVGDTVRRPPGERAAFVHALLRHLAAHGWPGAPRYLGDDEHGREMLTYVDGHVAAQERQPESVTSDESLRAVAVLVRELHELTAGTELAATAEVVCHNDLSPKNTVYRDTGAGLRPVTFIDWDIAAPGARVHDVAHVCWQYVGLGPSVDDVGEAARRVRVICDAYGLDHRRDLVDTVLWWQERCWRGIEAAAADGDPAMAALRDGGVAEQVRAAHRWTLDHRDALERALG
ncbi:phosphotransferase family enzyme [Haloactinopolyspora alba]|uniref:Phosphotransferase family enzyme n=1 Tax=Haloactinopolyspora alba TaxID=648780 RepID=A0A2P8EGH0_9ACTN|nr:phosphotransferase [Haloactinopolyspora alba]PSL08563.1 phosphotransferase family enzyme [Haloactinopolyspora alba]